MYAGVWRGRVFLVTTPTAGWSGARRDGAAVDQSDDGEVGAVRVGVERPAGEPQAAGHGRHDGVLPSGSCATGPATATREAGRGADGGVAARARDREAGEDARAREVDVLAHGGSLPSRCRSGTVASVTVREVLVKSEGLARMPRIELVSSARRHRRHRHRGAHRTGERPQRAVAGRAAARRRGRRRPRDRRRRPARRTCARRWTFLAGSGVDLIITSGGLGPTADDLTAEVVARFQGRPPALDAELERHIAAIVERLSAGRGWRIDPEATAAATRKQALVPDGAGVLDPVGTAPGLVVPVADGRAGPAGRGAARAAARAAADVAGRPRPPRGAAPPWRTASELRQRTIRLWGTPGVRAGRDAARARGRPLDGLEITTCLRDGELEIVTRFAPAGAGGLRRVRAVVATAFADTLFSTDGRTVDEIVADAAARARA